MLPFSQYHYINLISTVFQYPCGLYHFCYQPRQSCVCMPAIFHWVWNSKNGHVTLTTQLSGMIFIDGVGLAMANPLTWSEVSRCSRYEPMNGGAKCIKGAVWSAWLATLKVIGSVTIRYSACDFLFNFNRNYAAILYHFWRCSHPLNCPRSPILTYPVFCWLWFSLDFVKILRQQKTSRAVSLSDFMFSPFRSFSRTQDLCYDTIRYEMLF